MDARQPDPLLTGVDIPILLNSTPEETLAHRRSRSRDGAVDSPFTTMVLELEQARLQRQAAGAEIIVAKSGELLDHDAYLMAMGARPPGAGPMLNVYPDSIGGTLADLAPPSWPGRSSRTCSVRPTCCRASSTPTSTAGSR